MLSSIPVALVALSGSGLNESKLKDLGQNFVRNQLAGVSGASVPQPFGGRWRQIMLYADPTSSKPTISAPWMSSAPSTMPT